jgi:ATP-dependent exoDNAse (exonuclease V) alpha subunit
MNTNSGGGGIGDGKELAALVARFRQAPAVTATDRAARDGLLDELQEAVGLSGKMVTEADILRRADRMLQQP